MKYSAVQNLAWANAAHTAINAVVTFDGIGAVPFSTSADDPEAHGRAIFAKAVAGELGTVAAYVAPAVVAPTSVTPLQARKALRASGLKSSVDAFIATLTEAQREEWEYCIEVRRDNALIAAAAAAMGLTSSDIDNLFSLAATL